MLWWFAMYHFLLWRIGISSDVSCVFVQPQGLGRRLRVRPHIDGSWGLRSGKRLSESVPPLVSQDMWYSWYCLRLPVFDVHSDCSGMPSIPIISSSSSRSPHSRVLHSAVPVRKLEGLSPLDVLRHVAFLRHLGLQNSPTYHYSAHDFAVDICSMILEEVRAGLGKASLPQDLWPKLDSSGRFLLFWFFPDHLLGRRHNPAVEIVLAVVWACKALLWLPHAASKKSLTLVTCWRKTCRHALTHGCELQHAWSLLFLESLVSKQQLLVNNCSADFGLYHWFSSSWRYVGIGKLWRPNHDKQGGLTRRLFEHLQGAMRPQYREGYKLRYRLSRKTPLWSSMFLILLTGPEHYIRACEFVEIKLHSPNGNGMPLSCKRARKKMRNRPPKHMRKSCQAQDLSFRDRLIDQKRERLSQDQLLAPEPVQSLWDFPFKTAYCLKQKLVLQKSGVVGPLNIFAPEHRSLFLLFLASRRCRFSWSVAEAHDPEAAIKCAKQLKLLKKPTSANRGEKALGPLASCQTVAHHKNSFCEGLGQVFGDIGPTIFGQPYFFCVSLETSVLFSETLGCLPFSVRVWKARILHGLVESCEDL